MGIPRFVTSASSQDLAPAADAPSLAAMARTAALVAVSVVLALCGLASSQSLRHTPALDAAIEPAADAVADVDLPAARIAAAVPSASSGVGAIGGQAGRVFGGLTRQAPARSLLQLKRGVRGFCEQHAACTFARTNPISPFASCSPHDDGFPLHLVVGDEVAFDLPVEVVQCVPAGMCRAASPPPSPHQPLRCSFDSDGDSLALIHAHDVGLAHDDLQSHVHPHGHVVDDVVERRVAFHHEYPVPDLDGFRHAHPNVVADRDRLAHEHCDGLLHADDHCDGLALAHAFGVALAPGVNDEHAHTVGVALAHGDCDSLTDFNALGNADELCFGDVVQRRLPLVHVVDVDSLADVDSDSLKDFDGVTHKECDVDALTLPLPLLDSIRVLDEDVDVIADGLALALRVQLSHPQRVTTRLAAP